MSIWNRVTTTFNPIVDNTEIHHQSHRTCRSLPVVILQSPSRDPSWHRHHCDLIAHWRGEKRLPETRRPGFRVFSVPVALVTVFVSITGPVPVASPVDIWYRIKIRTYRKRRYIKILFVISLDISCVRPHDGDDSWGRKQLSRFPTCLVSRFQWSVLKIHAKSL